MLTPPAPAGAQLIYQPKEGSYTPSPLQGLANWQKELTQLTPQAGLL